MSISVTSLSNLLNGSSTVQYLTLNWLSINRSIDPSLGDSTSYVL